MWTAQPLLAFTRVTLLSSCSLPEEPGGRRRTDMDVVRDRSGRIHAVPLAGRWRQTHVLRVVRQPFRQLKRQDLLNDLRVWRYTHRRVHLLQHHQHCVFWLPAHKNIIKLGVNSTVTKKDELTAIGGRNSCFFQAWFKGQD